MSYPSTAASLDSYRHDLVGVCSLSPEAERDCSRAWRAGDQSAGRRLIEASLPFVISIAAEYRSWGVALEDLIQQGNLGLLKAAARFEPERGCRLITYAVYWIRAEIRDYVVRGYRIVRIGGSKGERRALRAFRKTREDDPSALAALSGLSAERAAALIPMFRHSDVSLDASQPGESPGVERVRDGGPDPEEMTAANDDRERKNRRVREALDLLSERERWIIERRILSDEEDTLESLGDRLGISKERVRQLEARAVQKLRGALVDLAA